MYLIGSTNLKSKRYLSWILKISFVGEMYKIGIRMINVYIRDSDWKPYFIRFLWVARLYFQKSWNLISEEGITSFRGTRRKKFHKWNSLPWNRLKTFWWMVFFPNKTAKWRIKRLIFSCEKTWTEVKFEQKWSLQDQSAMKHLVSCILITCNSENSAPKFPQNNNINTELKPHDNDDVAA